MPPSAVWIIEIPSLALRDSLVQALDLGVHALRNREAGGIVTGAVDAQPDDRRCSEVASEFCEELRLRWAVSEATLVLMICGILILLSRSGVWLRRSGLHGPALMSPMFQVTEMALETLVEHLNESLCRIGFQASAPSRNGLPLRRSERSHQREGCRDLHLCLQGFGPGVRKPSLPMPRDCYGM
jgi:hypothetical protein